MNKKYFTTIVLICIAIGIYARGRDAVAYEVLKNPSILLEPGFWIAVVVCLVLVGIYFMVKDKGK